MNRHIRLFRRLLRVYPPEFRSAYGDEMTRLFAEQLSDATASRRPLAVTRLWVDNVIDVLMTAPDQHLRKEQPVVQPVNLPSGGPVGGRRIGSAEAPKILLGLLPVWLLLFFQLAAPGFLEPAFRDPPGIMGAPAGLFVLAVVAVLTVVGVVALRRVSSTQAVTLVLLGLTAPAVLALVLTPAFVLILANSTV
jgi:hypothetical protein